MPQAQDATRTLKLVKITNQIKELAPELAEGEIFRKLLELLEPEASRKEWWEQCGPEVQTLARRFARDVLGRKIDQPVVTTPPLPVKAGTAECWVIQSPVRPYWTTWIRLAQIALGKDDDGCQTAATAAPLAPTTSRGPQQPLMGSQGWLP